jgi:tripartite-type tricarboxylate transporter receptor subunit TctC
MIKLRLSNSQSRATRVCFLALIGWAALSVRSFAPTSALGLDSAQAAEVGADFYKGKTITFLISGGAGGAYDTFARVLAQHIGQHIPGNPSVVPTEMVGAGGITATNYLYNAAPKDGTVIAMVNNPIPFLPLLGEKKALYVST